ncbi:MAG: sel1 repeat family protein [Bacteroidaceae bacterium]|nr:sel1 repeat family protein [Bacteroidaceae bacterium]
MAEVFISCTNNDINDAQQVKYEIDDYLGTNCSINNSSSRGGQLPSDVTDAIDRAGVFVFMLSGSSLSDQKTIDEIAYAHFRGKRIVVISLEGTTMPNEFIDRFGYRSPIDYSIDTQRIKLLRNLRAWLGVTSAALMPPPRGARVTAQPASIPPSRPSSGTATPAATTSPTPKPGGGKFGSDALMKAMARLKGTSTTPASTATTTPATQTVTQPTNSDEPEISDDEMRRYSAEQLYDLGYDYYNATGGRRRDYVQAVRFYTAAVRLGHVGAACNLGLCYEFGNGVPADIQEAVVLYRQAANGGNANGACNLGWLYESGSGVQKDFAEAVRYYQMAADKGLARGQCNLAYMYDSGMGVAQNYSKALFWYHKAADQDYARAMCNIGWCYEAGHGVTKDLVEANKWYQKGAEKGNPQAMHNLAWNLENGYGIAKDIEAAVVWYRKAADTGHDKSRKALIRLGR